MGLYQIVLKHFNLTRVLFGMKPLKGLKSENRQADKNPSLDIVLEK